MTTNEPTDEDRETVDDGRWPVEDDPWRDMGGEGGGG